ncbi:MAG TPA: M24 family metallopeptidase [Bdellovibrionota bacterium]|nr:M24 family metallopeptidase [Bdellovibrionota bacterium]
MTFPLTKIQEAIGREKVDGWLFYDFQGLDPIARRILGFPENVHATRRWYYFVPKSGTPRKLAHKIEPASLDHLPGDKSFYAGWRELQKELPTLLSGARRVAMNYSPSNAIPYVSRVDAGTIEQIRAAGAEVVTAADLVQQFEAVWNETQLQTHIRAAKALRTIVDETFGYVAKQISANKGLVEYDVQQFIWDRFTAYGLRSDYRPIAAVGPNAGNPHYSPEPKGSLPVRKGDFLLIDLWAKEMAEDAVFADITWTGYLGKDVPEKFESIFQIVRGGRDASLELVEDAVHSGKALRGYEVDDAARNYIASKGYGDYFIHRTGHNIGLNVHGNGANMDNFESRDERKVLPRTCFSIEPGIYLKDFGVRSEIDVYVTESEATVYGQPIQTTIVPILK